MAQKLVYCRRELRAPERLVDAVRNPDLPLVHEFLAGDPELAWADHLFLFACRVPGYEGHGGSIEASDKSEPERCEIVRLLVRHGAHPSMRNNRKVSPLHMACRFDLPRVAATLLELGAEVDAYDDARETPIFRAVNPGYVDCVAVLLRGGADLAFQNRKGLTPLHRAVMRGRLAVLPLLLQAGADRSLRDKSEKTPADYCRNRKIADLLTD